MSGVGASSYAQNYESPPAQGSDLAVRVKQALHSDKALDDRHIDVAVVHDEVVLTGFVEDSRELLVAGEVAAKAAGTKKIVNHLSVKQNPAPAP
jgi:osmotically-inducible protein OsmY